MDPRRVLITGGFGFIGYNLCKYLREHTTDHITIVDIVSRQESTMADETIQDDIVNLLDTKYETLKFDVIFHLAASSKIRQSFRDPGKAISTNVNGTFVVCELARRCNAKIIYASIRSSKNMDYRSPYVTSKRLGEEILQLYSNCYKIHAVIVRVHNVYGNGEPNTGEFASVIGKFLHHYHNNEPLTVHDDGNHSRDFIHVDDVCRGIVLLSHHPNITHCPIIELASGQYYSIMEIVNMIYPNPAYNVDYVFVNNHDTYVEDNRSNASTQTLGSLVKWHPIYNLPEYIAKQK
jgi:UDP-glucose 4-epimerase